MIEQTNFLPSAGDIDELMTELSSILRGMFQTVPPMPATSKNLPQVPSKGKGANALPKLWLQILSKSTRLDSPLMSGHMDTAPHPYAVMTQTIVSALNQNMLFRELSPMASQVEEDLVDLFIDRLVLGEDWSGTWASGGSIANLTALFCALGGYESTINRSDVHMLLPESGHASLKKAAAILGIPKTQIHLIKCNDAGAIDVGELAKELNCKPTGSHCIVTSVLGTTIHGTIDNTVEISAVCRRYGAWHHVDAVYGGSLMFSQTHRQFLEGLSAADSIVVGPQKWMYVPRVSAAILVSGRKRFDKTLGVAMPYSISGEAHRGFWGVQGSRPADAVVLWALLQTLGTDAIGAQIDKTIELTSSFHKRLIDSSVIAPAHIPDLNVQVIRTRTNRDANEIQRNLTHAGGLWASVSQWRDQKYLRTVLLSPNLTTNHIQEFVKSLELVSS